MKPKLQNEQLQKELAQLKEESADKKQQIADLQRMQSLTLSCQDETGERLNETNERTRALESPVANPPFNAKVSQNLTHDCIKFVWHFLGISLSEVRIKACHVLPGNQGGNYPSVIIKFIYFDDKNAVYAARRHLKKVKHPVNKRYIFINERIPKDEAELVRIAGNRISNLNDQM